MMELIEPACVVLIGGVNSATAHLFYAEFFFSNVILLPETIDIVSVTTSQNRFVTFSVSWR